jgi:hypothetical protein
MYIGRVNLTLTNVTVSGNRAGTGGGWGIYYKKPTSVAKVWIRNSVIWGNGTAEQKIKYVNVDLSTSTNFFQFNNTLVDHSVGGSGIVTGSYNASPAMPFSGPAAAIFADPLPPESAPESAPIAAYQLKSGIWINAGNNGLYTGPSTDFAGNARPQGTAIDLGAYEKE